MHDHAGIERSEFDLYFQGANSGIGIFFDDVWSLEDPIKIQDWEEQGISFQPPQGFRYATADELAVPRLAELMVGYETLVQPSLFE